MMMMVLLVKEWDAPVKLPKSPTLTLMTTTGSSVHSVNPGTRSSPSTLYLRLLAPGAIKDLAEDMVFASGNLKYWVSGPSLQLPKPSIL